MNRIKFFFSFLFFLSLCTGIVTRTESRDAFDDLIAFVDDPSVADLIISSNVQTTRAPSKQSILVLLNDLEIVPLLQENFYLRTNNLNHRSLLDYPEYFPFRHDKDKRAIYFDLFYNQTSRMNFTKESSNICSYLGIFQPSFITKVQTTINLVKEVFPDLTFDSDQILRLLDLFQTFTVQERRLGLMIGGKTTCNKWHFHIMAPWYYLERNHFVNDAIKEDIEQLIIEAFGPSTLTPAQAEKQQNAFIDQHLIDDKFGIGDTRIYLDYPIIKKKYWSSRAGFLATIPTAWAFKKGLKGTNLKRIINRPILNLIDVFEQALPPISQVSPQVINFLFAALDDLGAILLDAPLGNNGHLGIGTYIRNRSPLSAFIKQNWARRYIMRSFISLEYLFPGIEWRSFRVPANEALFNERNFSNTTDQAVVNSNFAFVEQQLTDRLFPIALQTRVSPGIIFRWSSQLGYEGDRAGFTIGTDTYVQNKEKFSKVYGNAVTKRMIDIFNARAPLAYQSKVVGSVFGKIYKPDRLYTVALIGDYTFMNKGIGADFTLALNFDVTF